MCAVNSKIDWTPRTVARWLLDSEMGPRDKFVARWIVLRALGLIYFSAFFSLVFQIRGLIGPNGILPANHYLAQIAQHYGSSGYFYAPTLAWFSSGSAMLMAWCWIGMIASLLLALNFWPRGMLFICFVCFLSFVGAAGEFAGYQSDGMLLEAGFIAMFFAPRGWRPGWGTASPPSRMSLFLLQWEWFRIYFESGIGKLLSGDPDWRHLTAMDQYYQNGPLPTWIGWYVQHLPHGFHAATAALTLALEIGIIWLAWLPKKWHTREVLFFIVTPWEIGIILTANYTFLNYLVLVLGFLLLADQFLKRISPRAFRALLPDTSGDIAVPPAAEPIGFVPPSAPPKRSTWQQFRPHLKALSLSMCAVILGLIFYDTTVEMIWMIKPSIPFPTTPVIALEPLRIANQYGLFEVMTPSRYEIEFQGSDDEQHWVTYQFKFKPQDVTKAPGIYAPYQPRFEWNLWFASLADWRRDPLAIRTEESLIMGSRDVAALFVSNPFPSHPPKDVRAIVWQYTFSTMAEKREKGIWWNRKFLGLYSPALQRAPDGKFTLLDLGPPETITP
jgi:lipase maturation factor 1